MNNAEFEALLRAKFLEEAGRLLEKAQTSFTALHARVASASDLDQIYRLAHNFKSGAKTVGFEKIGDFSAAFEALANQVRHQETELTPAVEEMLERCFHALGTALERLRADPKNEPEPAVPLAEIKALLRKK